MKLGALDRKKYGQRGKYPLAAARRDADGRNLCRWCEQPIPVGSRRTSWCGQKCVDEYLERGSWPIIRGKIIKRDENCRLCGDGHGKGWEVDHILAVKDGGTDDPTNLRLLCRPCHKGVTADWRKSRSAG